MQFEFFGIIRQEQERMEHCSFYDENMPHPVSYECVGDRAAKNHLSPVVTFAN
jgi:hypothetical protein